jgi:hypothetical protein
MQIVETTPTQLSLRIDLIQYRLFNLLVGCFFLGTLVYVFLNPSRMELQCQRSVPNIACQVTTWNMLYLHSQTKPIQLQDARAEDHHTHRGMRLILETTGEEIIFPYGLGSNEHPVVSQQEIRDFLDNSSQSQLDVTEDTFGLDYLIGIFYLVGAGANFGLLLRSPIWIKWNFVLEPDIADHAENIGHLNRTFQGLGWKSYVEHQFDDAIGFETHLKTGVNHLNLKLRSGERLALSPVGLSEADWEEVTSAISEILKIDPPQLSGKK